MDHLEYLRKEKQRLAQYLLDHHICPDCGKKFDDCENAELWKKALEKGPLIEELT